jgi:hypothetical protein
MSCYGDALAIVTSPGGKPKSAGVVPATYLRAQQVDELAQWMVQDASLDRRGLKLI